MVIGMLSASSGRFFASEEDIKNLIKSKRGIIWDMALNDGCLDPNYCRGKLKITSCRKERVAGTLVYNGKPRRFSGKPKGKPVKGNKPWEMALAGKREFWFKFTEPAASF